MAVLAQGLPIRLIPEQSLISPVRNDVIHYGCWGEFPLVHTPDTQRMELQEYTPLSAPARIIPTGISSAAQAVAAPHNMILAEYLPADTKARAARIPTGSRR